MIFVLFSAVLTASLLGSAHCAGMCGAFAAFAVTPKPGPNIASKAALNVAYNGGRLITYSALGLAAGSFGALFDFGGALLGIQRAAVVGAAVFMIGFALLAILRQFGFATKHLPIPSALTSFVRAAHARAFDLSPIRRALAVGMLTTLLPCGWLYAFVITSAGTANPFLGAATMAVFWLGTLPVMAAIGFGVQFLTGQLRRHLPLATNLLIIGVGMWMLAGRIVAPAQQARLIPTSMQQAVDSLPGKPADTPCPLCEGHTP
ncbi:MAG: sulfite exporter TauE/SafE family protein [Phycisphaerales bacterium]